MLARARQRIVDLEEEARPLAVEFQLRAIDDILSAPNRSDLEKAFCLLLNQFWGDPKRYFVVPGERVQVPNVHDLSGPSFEYEIDFAVYSGTTTKPIKIALECDGIRSHRQRHSDRDRRKNVNLQAAGWVVLRYGSVEIRHELKALAEDENYGSCQVE